MSRRIGILAGLLTASALPCDRSRSISYDTTYDVETSRERRKRKATVEKKKARKNVKASRKKNRGK